PHTFIPPRGTPCEIRLLSVEPHYRKTAVFAGLVKQLAEAAKARGCDVALISGTIRQLRLYAHLGFEPFGPLVGKPGAYYQPMMLTLEHFENRGLENHSAVSFLPGPVEICSRARAAFASPAVSHRSPRFG